MEILATCTVEESLKYKGGLKIENEGGKPDKVSLNIVVTDGDTSILKDINSNVKCITYKGNVDFEGCDIPKGKVFKEVSYSDNMKIDETEGVTTLVRVEKGYSNMRALYDLCKRYSFVRVIGGNLLNIDGVRIGRYDTGKDKGLPVYCDIYDQFLEIPLSEIGNLSEVVKKARKKLNSDASEKKSKSPKEKKTPAKKNDIAKSFTSLFSGVEAEEF